MAKVDLVPPPPDTGLTTPCLLWRGTVDRDGYGQVWREGRTWRAHVWSYVTFVGSPPKETLDHRCRRRRCVQYDGHLVPEGRVANAMLAPNWTGNRTACATCGRAYDEANTLIKGDGKRRCRHCTNAGARARRARKRSQST